MVEKIKSEGEDRDINKDRAWCGIQLKSARELNGKIKGKGVGGGVGGGG